MNRCNNYWETGSNRRRCQSETLNVSDCNILEVYFDLVGPVLVQCLDQFSCTDRVDPWQQVHWRLAWQLGSALLKTCCLQNKKQRLDCHLQSCSSRYLDINLVLSAVFMKVQDNYVMAKNSPSHLDEHFVFVLKNINVVNMNIPKQVFIL